MSPSNVQPSHPVTLPDSAFALAAHGAGDDGVRRVRNEQRDRASRDALVSQMPARLAAGCVVGLVQAAILYAIPGRGDMCALLAVTGLYIAVIFATWLIARAVECIPPVVVTTCDWCGTKP